MAEAYAAKAARTAAAQLAEAAGFEAAQQSSLDTLADLLLRYIAEVGSASQGYAELAGRTESNPLDVVLALSDLGVKLEDLSEYARVQDEIPFAQPIAGFPIKRKAAAVPTFADKNEAPPSHVPSFLPAFPDKHTYMSTPAYEGHERDPAKRQQREAAARQDAVRAVVRLQSRLAPDNKLLEKRAPAPSGGEAGEGAPAAAPAGAAEAGAEPAVPANPFLAPTLWENRLDQGSVSAEPAQPAPAPAAAVAPAAAGGAPASQAVAAVAADLAGEWRPLAGGAEPAAGPPLFVSWDWKAHLQKKARLAASGGEVKDAFGAAVEAHGPGTKHGRRGKRTERAMAAQLEIGDPTRRRVEEILAAQQEDADGGAGDEEPAGAAPEQEHI